MSAPSSSYSDLKAALQEQWSWDQNNDNKIQVDDLMVFDK